MSRSRVDISETPFSYESGLAETLNGVAQRVRAMRASGALTPEVLSHIRRFFRVKNIYHSNAIEENQLSLGETELVVREGMKRRRTSVLQPEDQIGRIYQMGEAGDLVGLGRQIDFRPLTAFTSRLGQRYIRCAVCLPPRIECTASGEWGAVLGAASFSYCWGCWFYRCFVFSVRLV